MNLSFKFELNLTADDLKSVIDDEVREYANEQLYRDTQEYVPYKTGAMMNSVKVDETGIYYHQWYAPYAYIGINPKNGKPYHFRKNPHPLATEYWDEAFALDKYDDFLRKIEKFIRDRKL